MDLTNRVEMLESELIAIKLCKLKMEADKSEVEMHAKEMEKNLRALQAIHNPEAQSVRSGSYSCACFAAAAHFRSARACDLHENCDGVADKVHFGR